MFQWLRSKFGPTAVTLIIGFIAFVFIFFGIYSPRQAGMRVGGAAVTVNGDAVTMAEFGRAYEQRLRFFQNMMKGQIDPALLAQLGLKKTILDDLVQQKLVQQQVEKAGFVVADAELAQRIKEMPYFQKNGAFDRKTYEDVLKANGQTPGHFEQMLRQDLANQKFGEFLRNRVKVAPGEVLAELGRRADQRQVQYAVLSYDDAKKKVTVSSAEVQSFLKQEANLKAAKQYYEANGYLFEIKPKADKKAKTAAEAPGAKKPFEQVQSEIAESLIRDQKADQVQARLKETLESAQKALAGAGAPHADSLKKLGLEVKSTGWFSQPMDSSQGSGISGLMEAAEMAKDAFATESALAKGSKTYDFRGGYLLAWGLQSQKKNPTDLDKEKDRVLSEMMARKERDFYSEWMESARSKAKIVYNDDLLKSETP